MIQFLDHLEHLFHRMFNVTLIMHILFRLIGPVAIGVLIKYQSEKGATYLQKITTPFTVFVLLFNLTVNIILQ